MITKKTVQKVSEVKNPKTISTEVKLEPNFARDAFYQSNLFIKMALDMTWQLALAVIIPIVGGFWLDRQFDTAPYLTITGFLIAALLVLLILRQVVKAAAVRSGYAKLDGKNGH